jgi:hypothetical protein
VPVTYDVQPTRPPRWSVTVVDPSEPVIDVPASETSEPPVSAAAVPGSAMDSELPLRENVTLCAWAEPPPRATAARTPAREVTTRALRMLTPERLGFLRLRDVRPLR